MPKVTSKYSNILVTGAGGFIGKVVVKTLLENGYHVTAMVRPGSLVSFDRHDNLEILRADILDYDSYADSVNNIDCIVHLAANKYHPTLSYRVNVEGAQHLVRLVKEKRLRQNRIINMSSQSTKHKWKGVYGKTKLEADIIIERSKAEWTTLMPNLVYGPEEGSLFMTIVNYTKKLPLVPLIGDGSWRLYPIRVEDVAEYIVKAIEEPETIRNVYELGSKKMISFDELIRLIQKELGIRKPILHIPFWFGLSATWLASLFIKNLPISVDNVIGSNQQVTCETEDAVRDMNFKPVEVLDGVKGYLKMQKEKKPVEKDLLHVAIVGLGKMGILHSSVLSAIPEVKITALIDMDKQLGKMAQSMGVQANFYTSLADARKKEKIDLVFIITPTHVHKIIIQQCLKHKLPFLCEKPVMHKYEDFSLLENKKNEILKLSASGYFWIFRRESQYVKRLLDEGIIGNIKSYSCSLKHAQVFGKKTGWQFDKEKAGGGVLINDGPHPLSLIVYLFGKGHVTKSQMKYLYGNSVEDVSDIAIKHSNGITGTFYSSWSEKEYPVMTIDFEITGSNGTISFHRNVLTITKKGKQPKVLPLYEIPSSQQVFNLSPKSGGDAYFAEDLEFIRQLKKKKPVVHNLEFARQIELIIHEAYEKAETV
jgi:NADH dehydrogenase